MAPRFALQLKSSHARQHLSKSSQAHHDSSNVWLGANKNTEATAPLQAVLCGTDGPSLRQVALS